VPPPSPPPMHQHTDILVTTGVATDTDKPQQNIVV